MAHILVIDDDTQIRLMITLALERDGHKVTAAGDGEEGLQLFMDDPPDLVITDIIMPRAEGLEVIKKMMQVVDDIPIVAMSGGGRSTTSGDLLPLAKLMGARATLTKPFTRAELMQALITATGEGGV